MNTVVSQTGSRINGIQLKSHEEKIKSIKGGTLLLDRCRPVD